MKRPAVSFRVGIGRLIPCFGTGFSRLDLPKVLTYSAFMSRAEVTKEAMSLPVRERAVLAQVLWKSLADDSFMEDDEGVAIKEAQQRDRELSGKKVPARSHTEVIAAVRKSLACR